jgi:hypothetical protein
MSGNYILYSLAVLAFCGALFALHYNVGIGLGPTYIWARDAITPSPPLSPSAYVVPINQLGIRPPTYSRFAFDAAIRAAPQASTLPASSGCAIINPNVTSAKEADVYPTCQPQFLNTVPSSCANVSASGSLPVNVIITDILGNLARVSVIDPIASGERRRQANCARNRWVSSSAAAARSIALPACSVALANCLFDLSRSSVCIRPSLLPNSTSPTMPKAITASAVAVPHCSRNESYGGWTPAIINSAITATTTNPAHPHSHRSQDDDAFSNLVSAAFIIPIGRRHAGNGFRGFWIGVGVGVLIFGLLFGVASLL